MQSKQAHNSRKYNYRERDVKKMQNSSLWIRCPQCEKKTRTKVYEDTTLVNFPLYCPKCKKEYRINVVQLKMVLSNEPDA